MAYIDGYLVPVHESKRADYERLARMAAPIFIELGALQVVETWGDGLQHGHTTDFFMAVKAEDGENVVFSWIVWPDKETRDKGNAAMMTDPRFEAIDAEGVFNGKRMVYGGFAPILIEGELK